MNVIMALAAVTGETPDAYASCFRWAAQDGACTSAVMRSLCAKSCGDIAVAEDPCVHRADTVGPGSIAANFRRVAAMEELQPSIVSEDPLILVLDDFASAEQMATIAHLAQELGFGASGSSCSFKAGCNNSAMSCPPVEGAP